jgi:hypothetical protein
MDVHLPKTGLRRVIAAVGTVALAAAALGLAVGGPAVAWSRSSPSAANPSTAGGGEPTNDEWPITVCGTYSGKGCAATTARVDLQKPVFTHPTTITNPLFPISRLRSVIQLGQVDGKPFRSEQTLLPRTGHVRWDGKDIEVLLSQYTAWRDGRIEELAMDRYAQADDGSVWYLGEDVYDYVDGAVAVTEGTWLAGRDGPPAMIMPAHPRVGDVFRTENVIGVVFEEIRVKAVGRTVQGPRGPVAGAMIAEELHLDGTTSDKTFAPGYGEFFTGDGPDVEALAMAVPTDARAGLPVRLRNLSTGAWGILENVRLRDWQAADATIVRLNRYWKAVQGQQQPPPLVARRLSDRLATLTRAVRARRAALAEQAAVDVAQSALDLELLYRPAGQVDLDRIHLHAQQLRVRATAKDAGGVGGEVAVTEWVRQRLVLSAAAAAAMDAAIGALRSASDARNAAAAADHGARLGARARTLTALNP